MPHNQNSSSPSPPEEVHVRDFTQAEPAEEAPTNSAVHAIAAPIIDLHDEGPTARTHLDDIRVCQEKTGQLQELDQNKGP